MEFNKLLHDRQSQPQTCVPPCGRSVGLSETVKDMRQKLGGYSLSCVNDAHFQVRVDSFK